MVASRTTLVNLMCSKMTTKNNWFTTNLEKRSTDPRIGFEITFDPYPFKPMNFNSAVDMTVKEISNNYSNLYLALSGGYDSEFALRAFHKLNVPIKPIIVCFGNEIENAYAEKACKELSIEPIRINLTAEQFITYYRNYICNTLNSCGWHMTQALYAAEYSIKNNGTLITGNHFIGDDEDLISDKNFANSNEWDFYVRHLFKGLVNIDFYLYTVELAYSMLPEKDKDGMTWQKYKGELYNLEYRNKIRAKYPREVIDQIKELNVIRAGKFPSRTGQEWSREEFYKLFEKALIDV